MSMKNRNGRAAVAAAVVLATVAAAAWSAAAHAQTRTRSILVRPDNEFDGIACSLRIERVAGRGRSSGRTTLQSGDNVRIGDRVVICFNAEADGYVTLWSRDAEMTQPVRIYPNEFAASTAGERGAPVTAGEEVCIGDGGGFRLEVGPPVGQAEVYMHFTRDPSHQFDEDAFPQIRATRGGSDNAGYASSRVLYQVTR